MTASRFVIYFTISHLFGAEFLMLDPNARPGWEKKLNSGRSF
jgi:hypothetical protein